MRSIARDWMQGYFTNSKFIVSHVQQNVQEILPTNITSVAAFASSGEAILYEFINNMIYLFQVDSH